MKNTTLFKTMTARLLRLLPNKAEKKAMVPHQSISKKKDFLIETSIRDTYISCYYPKNPVRETLPVYINFHGGAFIMHSKDMDDPYCRYLANETGWVVINVDYAKAPEYPFPEPLEQSYEIIEWIKVRAGDLGIDPKKFALGGQSSGANIAASLCLLLKQKSSTLPLLQVLSCPMLDLVTPHAQKPEHDYFRAKYPQMAGFLNACYVPDEKKAANPLASPVFADVQDTAPALIISAGHDAFEPEAELYARKLRAAGIHVRYESFKECTHAFTHLGPRDKAIEAWDIIAEEIKDSL
ncbi:alpha/beta hydrolase [Halobacillus salinarum]|uniref:Alpha/beta hydrolase n=1 Tax=Halobacillus salinarum TaxID=2932257 RepID=A0ABY4EK04_9BACI|nr:alpha/beta hydrolase [Halobacillus salinarum]UOQ44413.1 alpha/beta hydrolase [Halobacillus salinarum]